MDRITVNGEPGKGCRSHIVCNAVQHGATSRSRSCDEAAAAASAVLRLLATADDVIYFSVADEHDAMAVCVRVTYTHW